MEINTQAAQVGATPGLEEAARRLLDAHCPSSAYQLLRGAGFQLPIKTVSPEDAGIWVCLSETLAELGLFQDALTLLDEVLKLHQVEKLPALTRVRGDILRAQLLLRNGQVDLGILAAIRAENLALLLGNENEDLVARAQIWCAIGYSMKRCYATSEAYLHAALEVAPTDPRVIAGLARLRTELDQRLAARRAYLRLAGLVDSWAKPYAAWGLAHIAYLLGEFEQAEYYAAQALELAPEMVMPLFVLAQIALARSDEVGLGKAIELLDQRSPQAELLTPLRAELEILQKRLHQKLPGQDDSYRMSAGKARRLEAFPTLVQHQDTCGPAVVELVLRYWVGSSGSPPHSEAIAEKIKYPHAGTPIYRMREFFHLYGFDTVRCQADIPILKKLIDSGLPVIIQQEYANSAHVSVVIGYDESAGVIELQDPMTHIVLSIPENELNQLRENYLDAALIAYPRYAGHEKTLMRMQLFNDPVLETADRVILDFDHGRFDQAVDLLEANVRRKPDHRLSWILLLHARSEILNDMLDAGVETPPEFLAEVREAYADCLERASKLHPKSEFILQFEGWGALRDRDYTRAQLAFQTAAQRNLEDARSHACLAECSFSLYTLSNHKSGEAALKSAWKSLQCDPTLPAANIWMARSIAVMARSERDAGTIFRSQPGAWSGSKTSIDSTLVAAWHYARSAVELDPKNGTAHLALAEVLCLFAELDVVAGPVASPSTPAGSALEAVDRALSYSPGLSDALLLKVSLLMDGWPGDAAPHELYRQVQALIVQEHLTLDRLQAEHMHSPKVYIHRLPRETTTTLYTARQVLVEIDLQTRSLKKAMRHIDALLEDFPGDPWGLGIRAKIACQSLLEREMTQGKSGSGVNENGSSGFEVVQALYAPAIEAAPVNMLLMEEYFQYQENINGNDCALLAFDQMIALRDFSQEPFAALAPRFHFIHARLLARSGDPAQSAKHYLMALNGASGILDDNELYEAISQVIETFPVHTAMEHILDSAGVSGFPPLEVRIRELGLALLTQIPSITDPVEYELRLAYGRQLLAEALQKNPEDARTALVLGHFAVSPADREALYRRALMIAPGWAQAREALADYLTETGRPDEALDLTLGYAGENDNIVLDRAQAGLVAAHGRALLGVGLFEEAARFFDQAIGQETALRTETDLELSPHLLWLYIGRWQAEIGGGQVTKSLRTAREAIRVFGQQAGQMAAWYLRMATSLRKLGRYRDAEQVVKKGQQHGLSDLDVLRAGYETALARRDFDEALEILDIYIQAEGSRQGGSVYSDGRLGWAEAERLRLLIQLGRRDEVVEFLEHEELDSEGWGQAAWNLILTDFGVQSDSLALQAANNALSLDPANHAGLFTRAEALSSMGRDDEAVAAWLALRDAHPEEHTAYEKLALRMAISGNLTQALQFADLAIALGAFCPFSWAARGVVHFFSDRMDVALGDLQLAWNRADLQQRRKNQIFWHLLALLKAHQSGARIDELVGQTGLFALDGYRPFEIRLLSAVEAKLAHDS